MMISLDTGRGAYDQEHGLFRETVRRFLAHELTPHVARWEQQGSPDRSFWEKAGSAGILGAFIPEEYGGPGGDLLHRLILAEEMGYCPAGASVGGSLELDQVAAYILRAGTEEQKRKWLPRVVSGETILAVAMTEAHAGSDLKAIRTTATADGDDYVINGSKTYISNAKVADLFLVACKSSSPTGGAGMSMIMIEGDRPGFRRGRLLHKMGMKAGDTGELFFDGVRVPRFNLLGGEQDGFALMMSELPVERYNVAARALGASFVAYEMTLEFVKQRPAFGKTVLDFQNSRFTLANVKTDLALGKAFLDECIADVARGHLDNTRSAMAKLWLTEMEARTVDACLQLHGGAGYMDEFPISKLYTAARVHRIYGGTSEIMRTIIGRSL